jgi:hypothetical protein
VPRLGVIRFEEGIRYNFIQVTGLVVKHGPELYLDHYRTSQHFTPLDYHAAARYYFTFRSSAALTLDYSEWFIRLTRPFDPTNTGGNRLPLADYRYRTTAADFTSNTRRRISGTAGVLYGSYYTGTRLRYNGSLNWRLQPYANIKVAYERNEIALPAPQASANLTLLTPEFEVTFRPNVFLAVFYQYNTQVKNMNVNARFQWRFLPMSDLFIVLAENYYSENLGILNRAVVVKLSWWISV